MRNWLSGDEREVIGSAARDFTDVSTRGSDCLSDTAIRAYHFGYSPFLSRIKALFHVRGCVYCFARTLVLDEPIEAVEFPAGRIRARVLTSASERPEVGKVSMWIRPAFLGSLAALVGVAVLGGILMRPGAEHNPVFRGTQSAIHMQVDRQPGGQVAVQWRNVPDAEYYNVDIYKADLQEVLFRERVTATKYELSQEEAALLKDGNTYYCRIDAMNEYNEKLASSGGLEFSIRAESTGVVASTKE